jgi:hypothetical protein
MYKDLYYWRKEAENLINKFGVSYNRVTSGYNKGSYSARIKTPDIMGEEFLKWKFDNFGCNMEYFTSYSSKTKEKTLEDLISKVANELQKCDYRKNQQSFFDLWVYYNEKKESESNNVYFDGRIGRENVDFFKILNGIINEDNWKNKALYKSNLTTKIGDVTNFKELYYAVKSNAKDYWLKNNIDYKEDRFEKTKPLTTFVFDEEKIPEIKQIESKLDFKPETKQQEFKNNIDLIKSFKTDKLKNEGFYKIGYRKDEFLKNNIVVGRERDLIFPTQEKRKSYFAIVDLDTLIASHNEKTFGNSENYPTNEQGRNVNDRNYSGDKNAQAKVVSVAEKLNPNIIITTSPTASGTPIITIDGIVVSGNNRIMSLKLAKADYKDVFANYTKTLYEELNYGGYGVNMAQVYDTVKNPVLVRIDTDFHSYITGELNKYNKSRGKSERQIDLGIRLSQQIKDNEGCRNALISIIAEQDIVSELYNDRNAVNRFKKTILECGIITENEISNLFTDNSLTENGKVFYETILVSLVLNSDAIEISQNEGIKSVTKNVVNAIIPLIKNKSFKEGSLIEDVNKAILIQNQMVLNNYKSVTQFVTEQTIFEDDYDLKTEKAIIINWFLNQKANSFKNALLKYNKGVDENSGAGLFGNNLTPDEIFNTIFVEETDESVIKSINIKEKFDKNVLPLEISSEKEKLQKRIDILEKAGKYTDKPDKLIESLKKAIKYL